MIIDTESTQKPRYGPIYGLGGVLYVKGVSYCRSSAVKSLLVMTSSSHM